MSERRQEHHIQVYVPAGETRLSLTFFVSRLDDLEQVRIKGISGALIQQTRMDTVFVIQKPRKQRKARDDAAR